MSDMIQTGLSAEQKRQLEEIAADRQMPTSAAIREAMREYLTRNLDKPCRMGHNKAMSEGSKARFTTDEMIKQVNATKRWRRRLRASPRKGALTWLSVPVKPATREKAQRDARKYHCSVSVLFESYLALEEKRIRALAKRV